MPRYYFNIRSHGEVEYDPDGIELPNPDAARREAIAAARDMVVEAVIGDTVIDQRKIEVVSENGEIVAIVPLQSVINM